jgi:hypothetical protein
VAYFPLDQLPELAFPSHYKAIEACRALHRDAWAIKDSFDRLYRPDGEAMLSLTLVDVIHEGAAEIARGWFADVQTNPTTTSYHDLDSEELVAKATAALSEFGRWLETEEDSPEISDFYRALGAERRAAGFGLHEVLSSLSLFRKHIADYARGHGVWERPIDVYRVLELDRRMVLFFDRAMFQVAKGFSGRGRG